MKNITWIAMKVITICLLGLATTLNAQEITKKRGKVTVRNENGIKVASGRVCDYNKTGTWKYWDVAGVLHHIATFRNDTLNGQYVEYDTDGSVTLFGNYKNGEKDGVWRAYYTSGQPLSENTYNNGRLNGRQIAWYENGEVREIVMCNNDQLISRKVWYLGGHLKSVENYKDGANDGQWVTYPDPNTTHDTFPSTVDEYASGQLHGWHYAFLNGKKMEEVHYVAGATDGNCTRWDEHGHLASEEHFTSGKRNGCCKYYDCAGILRTTTYVNGEQTGPQADFDRNGDTLNVTWYTNGVRDSIKTFHENGQMATRRVFAVASDNVEQSEYTEWSETGVRLLYGRYKGDMKFGEWYTYYASGSKMSLTTYDQGVICGPYVKWYENGKRMIEFTVQPDGSHTQELVWTEKGRPMRPGTLKYTEIVQSATPGETYMDPVAHRPAIDKHLAEVKPSHLQFEVVDNPEAPAMMNVAESDKVYLNPQIAPMFPGGNAAMQDYLDRHLVHPASLFNTQGTVFISYIVEKDGSISDIHAVQEVKGAPEFTAEALRVVRSFPKMEPGTVNGEAVRCRMIVPVQFNVK